MVWDALQVGIGLLEVAVAAALLLLCLSGVALLLHHLSPWRKKTKGKS